MLGNNAVVVSSVNEMQSLAKRIAQRLAGGMVVLLYGELGAGKTTFVQGVAQALGVGAAVTSPTFTLMTEYEVADHPTIQELLHLDLYRLPTDSSRPDPQVQAVLAERTPQQLILVEWPERLGPHLPSSATSLYFEHGATPSERRVRGTLSSS